MGEVLDEELAPQPDYKLPQSTAPKVPSKYGGTAEWPGIGSTATTTPATQIKLAHKRSKCPKVANTQVTYMG